ncbi:MAG: polysaccharide deacetylase [Longibaculum muris]|uniref:Peptidoglycan/xylan/chitin deacetylase (PgdA/CDA1 family) n=1 Tax=Longibaculum muris TaxID=1796628 RepID=A0A4R3Z4K1_9FIRM|nr:polysaccharide deacetylase [Longibaculum muris]KXU45212.1 polysaccharide deacetylase [Candidatus Stoquefichus sp. KLE1796]MCR1888113.1 polysaccharide deacetylase family protein [Longibaculum muris]MED9810640.1 polysaccharide deacetylase [Longibaculum muris]TCW00976.1 peptidoglycan/xylan/chitin deacetylase (PgdA/CDA1 family) [Longibaculum muris]
MKPRKKLFIAIICIIIAILVIGIGYFVINQSSIHFISNHEIEVNTVVDYSRFIDYVKDGKKDDVKIDSSQVNVKKVGEYKVVYKYKDEEKTLKVNVVDTLPPEFDVKSKKVALNQTVEPSELVKNIKDASQTKVSFAKNYEFNKVGWQEIEVIVKDAYDNETRKKVKVNVVKDEKAPEIIVGNANVVVGEKIDLKALATIKDDFDKNPTLKVESDKLDTNKIGTYQVKYIAKDVSGNQSEKTIQVEVVDKTKDNEKVVYLTFDDGPSRHTPEVLEILKRYQCKATFFITGMNEKYRPYIKTAYDQGHTIGLHTYSHNYSKVYASTNAYFKDLDKVGKLAKEYIGFTPKYIRFPGGGSNTISRKYNKGIMSQLTKQVGKKGYIYYDWNCENGDGYAHMSQSQMLKRATSSSAKKVMILMHDANGKQNTVDILPKVIEHYQKKGYTFKAIDDSTPVFHQHVNN